MTISSSDDQNQNGFGSIDDFLEHHGIKGMHWGIRRTQQQLHPGSTDFKTARRIEEKAKTHGPRSLTNKELQTLANRKRAEQGYRQTRGTESGFVRGHDAVKTGLAVAGTVTAIYTISTSPAAKAGASALKKLFSNPALKVAASSLGKFATRV